MEEILKYFKGDELAAKAWQTKYAIEGEVTPDDMHKRMAKEFARIENRYKESPIGNYNSNKLSEYGKNHYQLSEEEIYQLFKNFKYVVPGGSVMSMLGNTAQIGSLSNCFVIGQPSDSYGGIMFKRTEQAQLMKRRGGVGKDLSLLRPKGAFVNNAAKTSTGPVSFMDVDSEITREVAQGGRRGALMETISIKHPDSGDFIVSKQNLDKITGANISVKVSDGFMEAVEKDEDFVQVFPINLNIEHEDFDESRDAIHDALIMILNRNKSVLGWSKNIQSKKLWDSLVHCAWNTAEPGIMFDDRHHDYSPDGIYPQYRGVTTNPCGEIYMQPYDSCRLIHINLTGFVVNPYTESAQFDVDKLYEVAYKTMRLADDLIDLEIEAIDKILAHINRAEQPDILELELWTKIQDTAKKSRRAGVGFTGLADVFAMLGMQYGSEESLEMVHIIMDAKLEGELDATSDMARTRGSFDGCNMSIEYEFEKEEDADGKRKLIKGNNTFYQFLLDTYPEQTYRMIESGRRNVSWSTVAPTGTVSMLTQTSSGIEPIFAPYYERSKKCMSDDERVDFIDATGEKFTKFYVLHEPFREWMVSEFTRSGKVYNSLNPESLEEAYKNSPWFGSDSASINWRQRIELQSIVQAYTTHSISSTINLPKDTTEEVVSDILMTSWKRGLKGITIYRDGCRDGILNTISNEEKVGTIKEHSAPKRPKVLPADMHIVKSQGITYAVIIGLMGDKPLEIFAYELKKGSLGEKLSRNTKGTITKIKKGHYSFDSEFYSYPNLQLANDRIEERACTVYTSMLLRHGAAIPFIIDTTRKINDNITSFSSAMCRVLGKYTPKEEVKGEVCPECGSSMVHEAGCTKCSNCTYSKCLMVHQCR